MQQIKRKPNEGIEANRFYVISGASTRSKMHIVLVASVQAGVVRYIRGFDGGDLHRMPDFEFQYQNRQGVQDVENWMLTLPDTVDKQPILDLLNDGRVVRTPQYAPDPDRVQVERIILERIEGHVDYTGIATVTSWGAAREVIALWKKQGHERDKCNYTVRWQDGNTWSDRFTLREFASVEHDVWMSARYTANIHPFPLGRVDWNQHEDSIAYGKKILAGYCLNGFASGKPIPADPLAPETVQLDLPEGDLLLTFEEHDTVTVESVGAWSINGIEYAISASYHPDSSRGWQARKPRPGKYPSYTLKIQRTDKPSIHATRAAIDRIRHALNDAVPPAILKRMEMLYEAGLRSMGRKVRDLQAEAVKAEAVAAEAQRKATSWADHLKYERGQKPPTFVPYTFEHIAIGSHLDCPADILDSGYDNDAGKVLYHHDGETYAVIYGENARIPYGFEQVGEVEQYPLNDYLHAMYPDAGQGRTAYQFVGERTMYEYISYPVRVLKRTTT